VSTPAHDHAPLFEARLHRISPLPPIATGLVIAALLSGAYALLALQVGQDFLDVTEAGVQINPGSWAAFVISLIFAAALTMPERARAEWEAALPKLEATLDEEGRALARAIAVGPSRSRWRRAAVAFAIGAGGGVGFNLWLMRSADLSIAEFAQSTGLWFLIIQPLLFGLGVRAAVQLSDDDKDIARLVRAHLTVDLAQLNALEIYGRLALRGALSWLVMAAIILLFFVFAAPVAVSIGALVLALIAGGYAFASTIGPVVQRASAARDAKLAEVRAQIAAAGDKLLSDADPVQPLGELTAYESWLEKRPVWPISAPVSRRLALYGLIPVLAWFGAAAAELLLDRIAA
jgi:hypothetical protein